MRTVDQLIDKLRDIKDGYQECGYGELHDEIYYQIKGAIDYKDMMDDDLIKQLDDLTDHLESHLNYVKNEPEFNWVFG